jgi:hypothetical protein
MGESEYQPPPNPTVAAETNQAEPHENTETRPLYVSIVSQPTPPPKPDPVPNPKQKEQTPLWKKILEFSALGIALIVAGIYGGQLWVMKHQLTEMGRSTKAAENAAYVACVSAQISRSTLIEVQRGEGDTHGAAVAAEYQAMAATQEESADLTLTVHPPTVENGKYIKIPFELINVGKTVAKKVKLQVVAVVIPRNSDPNFTYAPKETAELRATGLIAGEAIQGPDGSFQLNTFVRDTEGGGLIADTKMVSDFRSGLQDVITYARVTYFDGFGVHHWMHFCHAAQIFPERIIRSSGHEKCAAYDQTDANRVISSSNPVTSTAESIPAIRCPVPVDPPDLVK